ANDLLIFATDASGNESGWTAGTGYAIPNNKVTTGASGSDIRMAMQYAVVNSTQTYTTGMTYTNSNWNGNIFAAFKITSASADPPAVSLSPTSLNFGNQNVGTTSAPQTVTLSNIGTATLSITSIGIENGDYSSDFAETNNCGTSLAAGASCAINVTFKPTATGTRSAALTVTDNTNNHAGTNQTVSLTGTGCPSTGCGGGGGSTPAVVQVQNNIDVSGAAFASFSVPITTNSGDLLVAFVRESSNGTDNFTVTDSAGQTWTQTASGYNNESNTGPRTGMFYVANS